MKVAIVHDWLVSYRGGERVLESVCKIFPHAPIYTLFYDETSLPSSLTSREIKVPKLLNKFRRLRRLFLPILPSLIESLPLLEYDLIISTSSCVAKGVIPAPGAKHICYIHSPMRYIWDQSNEYFSNIHKIPFASLLLKLISSYLRIWDVTSSNRVDTFIANSSYVAKRVQRYYGRQSTIIHPPVDLKNFTKDNNLKTQSEEYYLVAGAFVPYKRFELAILACNQLNKKLIVAGSGPMEKFLRQHSGNKTQFLISPSPKEWTKLMQNAKALIFPALEDFGIVAIEAMASGTPVLAYKKGGAQDFIKENENGLFFEEQTCKSLKESINTFEKNEFNPETIAQTTQQFSEEIFISKMKKEIEQLQGK